MSPRRSAATGWLGDGRGLTVAGAVLLAFLLGLAGLALDVETGTGLRTAFAVAFVLGCVLAAALVHHEDLMAALLMPPLLFVALAAVGSVLDGGAAVGSWFTRRTLDVVTAMVTDAPILFVAMAAVLAVTVVRFVLYRASVRRRRALARPPARRPAASA